MTFRGADRSPLLSPAARLAGEAGFDEIRVRTSGVDFPDRESAETLRGLGVSAVLVPFFSHKTPTHDHIAGRRGALVRALVGIRALAAAGLAVDADVPLLPPRLQDPTALVDLLVRAVPALRRVRFHLPSRTLPPDLVAPAWPELTPTLVRAIERCHELGATVALRDADGVPICALANHPELAERVVRFNARGKKPPTDLPAPCARCAMKRQCAGVTISYRSRHGTRGLVPFERRPNDLFAAQRTTPKAKWTEERRSAARSAGLQVLRPTVNCNQDCVFCSANETSHDLWEDPAEMMRTIVRRARKGVYQISFGGGEPTLSKHLVDFVSTASSMGVREVEVVTNAVLLARPEKARQLREAGLTLAFVSLHAHDEELSRTITLKAGDFEKTIRGIHNLLDAGVTVRLNHVINRLNYRYLRSFVEFVHGELGTRVSVSFAFVTPQYRGLENIELVPKLSDVMPYLARAMYRAVELGVRFVVGSRQGIPPCFLKEFAPWSDIFSMANEAGTEDVHQKTKAERCQTCRYADVCTGLWKPYVARHGLDELRPVAGEPVRRSELVREGGRAPNPLWVESPESFEAAADRFRDREGERAGLDGWPLTDAAPAPIIVPRSRPVRAVLVGTGRRAQRLFAALSEVPTLTVDAVASPHAPANEAARFDYRPAYASAAEALADVEPECMLIAAGTQSHADLVRASIDAGVPALVEKPVGGASDVVRQLAREAGAASVLVAPAHQVLFADGLDRFLARGPHRNVRCVRRVPSDQADLPRSWARAALFESLYHYVLLLRAATGGVLAGVTVKRVTGSARPESIALAFEHADGAADLVIEGDADVDELSLSADGVTWARRGALVTLTQDGITEEVERTASDTAHMLDAFARAVADGAHFRSTLEDAAAAIDATNMALTALGEAGIELARATEPRHAATKGLRPSYS